MERDFKYIKQHWRAFCRMFTTVLLCTDTVLENKSHRINKKFSIVPFNAIAEIV